MASLTAIALATSEVERPATRCRRHSCSRFVSSGVAAECAAAGARPFSASARSSTRSRERAQGKALLRAAGITRADERDGADLIVGGALRHDVAAADPVAAAGVEDLVARMAAGNQGAELRHADRPAAGERPERRRIDAQKSAGEIEFEPARRPVGEVKGFRRAAAAEAAAGDVMITERGDQRADAAREVVHRRYSLALGGESAVFS